MEKKSNFKGSFQFWFPRMNTLWNSQPLQGPGILECPLRLCQEGEGICLWGVRWRDGETRYGGDSYGMEIGSDFGSSCSEAHCVWESPGARRELCRERETFTWVQGRQVTDRGLSWQLWWDKMPQEAEWRSSEGGRTIGRTTQLQQGLWYVWPGEEPWKTTDRFLQWGNPRWWT